MGETKEQSTTQQRSNQELGPFWVVELMDAVSDNVEWCQPLVMENGDFHQYGWTRLTFAHGGLMFHRCHLTDSSSSYAASVHVDFLEHYKERLFCLLRPEDAYMVRCMTDAIQARRKACEKEAVRA